MVGNQYAQSGAIFWNDLVMSSINSAEIMRVEVDFSLPFSLSFFQASRFHLKLSNLFNRQWLGWIIYHDLLRDPLSNLLKSLGVNAVIVSREKELETILISPCSEAESWARPRLRKWHSKPVSFDVYHQTAYYPAIMSEGNVNNAILLFSGKSDQTQEWKLDTFWPIEDCN